MSTASVLLLASTVCDLAAVVILLVAVRYLRFAQRERTRIRALGDATLEAYRIVARTMTREQAAELDRKLARMIHHRMGPLPDAPLVTPPEDRPDWLT